MDSQNTQILNYLKTGTSITDAGARKYFGISRLAARIYDLSLIGFKFHKERVEGKNRNGKKTYFTSYSLAR